MHRNWGQNINMKKCEAVIVYFLKTEKMIAQSRRENRLVETRCSQKGDSVSFSLTPNFYVQIEVVCGPHICTQATKNTKMVAKWGRKQQEKASVCWGGFLVEFWGAEWLCTKFGNKKVSFHDFVQKAIQCIRLVPCTETGQNEVSKQTTEEVQGGNPGLLLFEDQKNSWAIISWSAVQKPRMHISVVAICT